MLINHLALLSESITDRKAVITAYFSLSYLELWNSVQHKSQELLSLGLIEGQTVGITIKDEFTHFLASLALINIGCNQITLPTFESTEYRKQLSSKAGVTVTISDIHLENLPGIRTLILKDETNTTTLIKKIKPGKEGCVYFVTSGTTGTPKIIILNETKLYKQGLHWQHPKSVDIFWRPTPIEYNNSKRQRLYNIACASTNVFIDASKNDIVKTVKKYNITRLNLSVVQSRTLANNLTESKRSLPNNCHVRIGGSAVDQNLRASLINILTKNLHITYATSEFGSISTAGPYDHCDMLNAGKIHPEINLQIVDDKNQPVKHGETGYIRVKSDGMADSYYNDITASELSFKHGWFYPGDIGRIEANGLLYISGRADDMLSLASINIFPSEIESAFCKHPNILECAAFGIKSNSFGDIPILAVVLINKMDMAILEKYGRDMLGIRSPRKIIPIDKIPRNRGGKISKNELITFFYNWQKNNV